MGKAWHRTSRGKLPLLHFLPNIPTLSFAHSIFISPWRLRLVKSWRSLTVSGTLTYFITAFVKNFVLFFVPQLIRYRFFIQSTAKPPQGKRTPRLLAKQNPLRQRTTRTMTRKKELLPRTQEQAEVCLRYVPEIPTPRLSPCAR